jgi:hypothetical protein
MDGQLSVTIGGKTNDLPRYDMALARKAGAIDAAEGREAAWRAEWDFLRAAIGDDALRDATCGDRVESCDLIALDSACAEVRAAYEAPQQEAMRKRVEDAMAVLSGGDLDRLVRAADAIGRLESRQGFRRVK